MKRDILSWWNMEKNEDLKPEPETRLAVVVVAYGQMQAQIIKSKLESEGIPVALQFEPAGQLYGISIDGLGAVNVLVPESELERARRLLVLD